MKFIKINRARLTFTKDTVRTVTISEVCRKFDELTLEHYVADRAPLFYRDAKALYNSLEEGYFLTPLRETLRKIPNSQTFRESHFGEIAAGIFAEEVLGLRKLYSKLSFLSAENANAYKMDLVLYNPTKNPLEIVFGEVKSSPKVRKDGLPAHHDKSCFADLFTSLNAYSISDLNFDLTAAKDHVQRLPVEEQHKLKEGLKPYADRVIKYAGMVVIDISTRADGEISLLATRRNKKPFDVDVICIQEFPEVAEGVYGILDQVVKSV